MGTSARIEYVAMEGLADPYFRCERLRATLCVKTCAQRFTLAASSEANISCRKCPVGAKHAGQPAPSTSLLKSRICARCFCQSPRIVGDRLCISCYNRTLETMAGVNSRGGRPKKLAAVYTGLVSVRVGSIWHTTQVERVSRFVETLVSAAKREDAAFYGWVSTISAQLHSEGLRRRQPCS